MRGVGILPRAGFVIWRRKNPRRHAYGSGRRRVMTINDPNYRAAVEIMNKSEGRLKSSSKSLADRFPSYSGSSLAMRWRWFLTLQFATDTSKRCETEVSGQVLPVQEMFTFGCIATCSVLCIYWETSFCSSWMIHSMLSDQFHGKMEREESTYQDMLPYRLLRLMPWQYTPFVEMTWWRFPLKYGTLASLTKTIKCFFCNTCHRIFGHEHICFIVFRGEAPR